MANVAGGDAVARPESERITLRVAQERADGMGLLICTVGLPRSGKTTWARSSGYPIVSPDAIRLAIHNERFNPTAERWVWTMAETMVRALFFAGHPVAILDATNVTAKRRGQWDHCALGHGLTVFKVIDTPEETCRARANARGDNEIIPVIERMAGAYEPLAPGELWLADGPEGSPR